MANTYQWHRDPWTPGGMGASCPGGTYNAPGWYSGSTLVTSTYINPSTGKPYTPTELGGLGGEGTAVATTTPTAAPTAPTRVGTQGVWYQGEYLGNVGSDFANMDQPEKEAWILENFGVDVSGQEWAFAGAPVSPEDMLPRPPEVGITTPTPTFGEGAGAAIPTPVITPAPAYEISPEQQEMMDMLGQQITDWVESGGYGLPEDVQAQMIQQQSDMLKAREQENIRVMRNNMERRGITNSGFLLSAENTIHSNTSIAIAGAIADVQIKSALMKMASFEKAMGAAAQFLGYLSEQSQLAYAPQFATWQAEQLAKMQAWQAKLDIYKMELNQAYQTQNLILQSQLQSQLNQQQHQYNLELAEMEIEATQQAAQAQGFGSIFGTILGFIFGK